VGALYDGFDAVGLQYGPGYRTLVQAWGSVRTALARLHARSTHEGTQVHPADLDDALCTSGVIASSGGDGETQLPFAVDTGMLRAALDKLWAAVVLQGPEAIAVRLGPSAGQSEAQLDGFKSRALRAEAPTQRHLYLTAWRAIDVAVAQGGTMLVIGDA